MSEQVSDEMLMALVDGELDPASARNVTAAVASDPALAARLDRFHASRAAVRDLYGAPLGEPVPDRLLAAVMAGSGEAKVVSLAAHRSRVRRFAGALALPLAACLVLALGFGGGVLYEGPRTTGGAFPALDAVVAQLPEQASGTSADLSGTTLRMLGTYAVEEGTCRVFDLTAPEGTVSRGVGCDRGAGYGIDMLARAGSADGFDLASDGATAGVDAFLDAAGAAAPLSAEAEAALLESAQSGSR